MKTKILSIIISFVFLFVSFSNTLYAFTNELENNNKISNETTNVTNIENNIEDSKETEEENIQEQENETNDTTDESENFIIENQNLIHNTSTNVSANVEFQGESCLDIPKENTKYIRPDDSNVQVEGWAVSNDSGAKVRLLVDGKITADNLTRISRTDVDKAISPKYGGTTNTPKAGYKTTLDITNLSVGTHTFRIEQYSKFGQTLSVSERKINITNKNCKGVMCLDTPKNNATLTKPNDNTVKVQGWAVSDDIGAKIRMLVDGKIVADNLTRTSRADVDKSVSPQYGGTKYTPKAGFQATLDISQLSYGKHTLKLEQYSTFGNTLSNATITINIFNQNYEGTMFLDSPKANSTLIKPDNNSTIIQGWAVSNDSNSKLQMLIDGKIVADNLTRVARTDVDKAVSPKYGGTTNTPKAGFKVTLDISNYNIGTHKLKIIQYSRYGEIISSLENNIKVENKKYQGTMFIDSPKANATLTRPDNNIVKIDGWAVSGDSNAKIRMLVDGKVVNNSLERKTRTDVDKSVSPQYGGTANTPKAGYLFTLDIENYSVGTHKLRLEQYSRFGDIINSAEINIIVANKKYQGVTCLDSPKSNMTLTRPDYNTVKIEGWAASNDSYAKVRMLVDGKVVNNNISRTTRTDIDKSVSPKYGGTTNTPKAGFSTTLNTTQLSVGAHRLRIEQYSRFGDVISISEININIANRKYQGAMCLDSPANNKNFAKPDEIQITLQGWASSNDSQATVKAFIDGNLVANNLGRTSRADIDRNISPKYGGTTNTPRAGYSATINIGNLSLGAHTLKVEQVSRYGDVISNSAIRINIVNRTYLGELVIDSPKNNPSYTIGTSFTVSGWAVSQDASATVHVYVDGVLKGIATRYARADVSSYVNKYGGQTANPGYNQTISTSGMSIGVHTVGVYEVSRFGNIIGYVETQFTVKSNAPTNTTASTKGIDVSQYQGNINWKSVASSGIKFTMIRLGYRGYGNGSLAEDTQFKTNFANAKANGLRVGVYFYSTSLNATEAKKDAEYVVSVLRKYGYQNQVTMPIAIDLELISGTNTRDKNLSKSARTTVANTFCSTIASYGYTPMVYASRYFLTDNMNPSQIPYDIWVAQYSSKCNYPGTYTIWQYTQTGTIPGISGKIDYNICYKNY